MSFATVNWSAGSIGKQVQMNVILPDQGQGPFPVFYLLHGLSDDYSIWHRRTRIEAYVAGRPVIVVMPDGYRGFYTNANEGPAYFDYMTKDLVECVDRLFPTRRGRKGRCVGGLSMGGYGALRMALGRPDLFASATSHSGALMIASGTETSLPREELVRIFGPKPAGSEHDLIELAKRCKKAGTLPRIRIDCGTEDFLLEHNRTYHQTLEKMKIAHEYQEFPGNHNWDYWDVHVREALNFHGKILKF